MTTPGEQDWIRPADSGPTVSAAPADTGSGSVDSGSVDRMVAVAAGLGMFLASLDIALNVALPSITEDFDTDFFY